MARSLTQLFRGLPAPVHVSDLNTRRIFDAIYENLRGLKIDQVTGQIYGQVAGRNQTQVLISQVIGTEDTTPPSGGGTPAVDRLVAVGAGDAAGVLAAKLLPNTAGTPLLTYGASAGVVASLKAGAGIAVTAPSAGVVELAVDIEPLGEGVHLLASSEAYPLGIKSLVEGVGVTLTDQSHSVLIELGLASGMTNAGGDSHPLLAVDTDPITSDQTMVVRGLRPGLGISMENDPEPAVDNADVLVSVDTSELEQTTFDAAGMTFLVAVPLQEPLMLVSLGAPAGCPFTTGTDAGSADTVARGDHVHSDYADADHTHTGLTLPEGVNGDVLVHNGTNWVASGLESLVQTIIGSYLAGKPTVTPTDDDLVFIQTPTGFAWGAAGPCNVEA